MQKENHKTLFFLEQWREMFSVELEKKLENI